VPDRVAVITDSMLRPAGDWRIPRIPRFLAGAESLARQSPAAGGGVLRSAAEPP